MWTPNWLIGRAGGEASELSKKLIWLPGMWLTEPDKPKHNATASRAVSRDGSGAWSLVRSVAILNNKRNPLVKIRPAESSRQASVIQNRTLQFFAKTDYNEPRHGGVPDYHSEHSSVNTHRSRVLSGLHQPPEGAGQVSQPRNWGGEHDMNRTSL